MSKSLYILKYIQHLSLHDFKFCLSKSTPLHRQIYIIYPGRYNSAIRWFHRSQTLFQLTNISTVHPIGTAQRTRNYVCTARMGAIGCIELILLFSQTLQKMHVHVVVHSYGRQGFYWKASGYYLFERN